MDDLRFTPSTHILRGLDEIAAYLKVTRRTAWRYINSYGLPALKLGPYMPYITSPSLIDMWIIAARSARRKALDAERQDPLATS
jgi:hypothetical protein